MSTETAPIDPRALRFARDQMRISQRELARRVATRLEREESVRAFQMRLSRLERGDEYSEEDRDWVDAVAVELAIGTEDLAEPPVYVWIKLDGDRPGIVELAMRMPCWSTPELAYAARDWLAHASEACLTPFKGAHLVPFQGRALVRETLDANYPNLTDSERKLLVAVDLPDDRLGYLAALNMHINADDPLPFEVTLLTLGESAERSANAAVGELYKPGELDQLHELALRRLVHAPPEHPTLVASWRLRERRLYELLQETWEIRRKWRDETIAGAPDG